ncbi:hypothetical protein GQ55_2G392400 [Panicum hallii var. hallii]|uniref:F-box/LRR-repeat protein 15/At3g58940/PEG3-like LRR domain-containing protein n=1 Tax=Panicum hallii var. hallii TaxID=1504633 RepID=A0A2T7EX60_9POAL|nr:hypothetical protein GQ55_2G392400 [Panicum hallii var. hallii]
MAAAGHDRISGLCDDLLVTILVGLHSAAEAARTSVLSRRWRRVWTKIPELILLDDSSSPDAVDSALAAYSAPEMDRFAVGLTDMSRPVCAARAASWLRFAAARAPREVHVLLPCKEPPPLPEDDVEEELEVPILESTLWLNAKFVYCFRIRLPPAGAGAFAELRILSVTLCRVSGGDLSRVVSMQCPCLLALELAMLDVDGDVSIRSGTLERLALRAVGVGNRLYVAAPSLEWLQVEWDDGYDPARHRFIGTGRRLDRLAVTQSSQMPPLLERFDAADELSLHLFIPPFPNAYPIFLENTRKLPKCKALTVGLKVVAHSIKSSLLHLLKQCGSITKLEIELIHHSAPKVSLCEYLRCPCVQQEMMKMTDNVALDLLEEVEFHFFTGSDEDVDLVKLLFMCKKTLKKMVINVADDVAISDEVHEKIKSFSHLSTTLEIGGPSSHKRDVCLCKEHDWY